MSKLTDLALEAVVLSGRISRIKAQIPRGSESHTLKTIILITLNERLKIIEAEINEQRSN